MQWHVELPTGWVLQTRPGNEVAVVDDGGVVQYLVTAPWARDQAGKEVQLSLSADGDAVALAADINPDTTFPVVVDPDWSSTYNFQSGSGSAGWVGIDDPVPGKPALNYTTQFAQIGAYPGLWIWPTGSTNDQYVNVGGDSQEVRGGSRFEAPGTTRIKRIDFDQVSWELWQEDCSAQSYRDVDQYLRFVLRDRNTDSATRAYQVGGSNADLSKRRNVESPAKVSLSDPNQANPTSTSASLTMWTEARTTADPKWIYPNPRPEGHDCADKQSPFVNVGRVDVQLIDTDVPAISEVSGQIKDWATNAHTAWINGDPGDAKRAKGTVRMHDAGAGLDFGEDGVRRSTPGLRATSQNGGKSHFWDISGGIRCDPNHHRAASEGRLCPEALNTSFTDSNPIDLAQLVGPSIPEDERDGPW
ncbi:MAG: hypothetical protein EOP29_28255, partial [Rhodococcus sp. (in: high G+C Gram-positive bacteria)]